MIDSIDEYAETSLMRRNSDVCVIRDDERTMCVT